jgi:hypothetical protein
MVGWALVELARFFLYVIMNFMDDNDKKPDQADLDEEKLRKAKIAKQLSQVICICKGIPLGRVLKGLEGSETVADVNAKVGTGSGGCKGERCGPRIKILLRKKQASKK